MVGACGVCLGPSRLCPPILPPQWPQPQPLAQPQPQPGFWHSPHSAAAPPLSPSPLCHFFPCLFFLFFLFCVGHDVTRRLQRRSVFLILLASLSWRDSKNRVFKFLPGRHLLQESCFFSFYSLYSLSVKFFPACFPLAFILGSVKQ